MARNKYSVSGLQGCLISVTGVAFEERAKICSMVQDLGGIYSPELKPQCSHLIFEDSPNINNATTSTTTTTTTTVTPTTTNSQSQGRLPIKVQYALKWEIPVVSKNWIYSCHKERILLEEGDYPALSNNYIKDSDEVSLEILPVKLSEIREDTPSFLQGCHVYLNGDSISSQRLAVLKRLILAAGGIRYTDLDTENLTHIVIHNQLLPNNLKVFLDQEGHDMKIVHDGWLFDSFKESRKLPEIDYEVSNTTRNNPISTSNVQNVHKWKSAFSNTNLNSNNSSFLNANANISFGNPRTSLGDEKEFLAGTPNVIESAAKVLKGKCVHLGNLKSDSRRRKLLIKARKSEMKIAEEIDEADWIITQVLIQESENESFNFRNEIWFEAALDSKAQLPSISFSKPIQCENMQKLAEKTSKLLFSQSGFTGPEREFYTELIKSSGAQYTDSLSKANTHLLIEEPRTGSKYDFAKKWKIECVDVDWLKKLISSEKIVDHVMARSQPENNNYSNNYNKPQSLIFHSQLSKAQLSFQTTTQFNFNTNETKSFDTLRDSSNLLKGLIFSSSQRLWHRREELSTLIESLGGVFLWSFDRSCTHYLHQGKLAEEAFKEFKQARQWNKFIVSPWWIVKCKESGKRLDETKFPHTYKEENSCATSTNTDTGDMMTDVTSHSNSLPVPAVDKTATTTTIITNTAVSLDWDSIMAERRAQEFLLRPGSKTFNIESHPAFIKSENSKIMTSGTLPESSPSSKSIKYKVVFSGYSSAEKTELLKLIENRSDLEVQDDDHVDWNPKKTILICNTLNFTEKTFSACATGCWILKKDFLSDVSLVNSGNLEKYELGPAWNANERDTLIGRAPKYWRQRLSNGIKENVPFYGWKCALIVESSRQVLYESVLRNGGAEVIPVSDLLSSSNKHKSISVTHFFCANIKSIPEEILVNLKKDQIFSTKHITNTIFRLND